PWFSTSVAGGVLNSWKSWEGASVVRLSSAFIGVALAIAASSGPLPFPLSTAVLGFLARVRGSSSLLGFEPTKANLDLGRAGLAGTFSFGILIVFFRGDGAGLATLDFVPLGPGLRAE